ncbi:hypothetical protein [Stackebrandtia nassauensis]|uniref:Integral membrane protein n=1 Tax=Stackebrandtia nassauensis (strain DSM 44728 / CIP 108903 / NRRL B-16338 / NBRC 102104 / LLR-40K-21) TaxID=446470 RepID=D3PUB3_STANL|nr:hypothetical protein [Stackebrandtia nassauensis]ADD41059.1 hypothetical protein Snas_1351 [Stackebrandtia nassauensis DSM 44728]
MELLRHALLYIHLLGFAMLFGGWLTAFLSDRLKINPVMLWGSVIQLATGIFLSAPFPKDYEPNYAKIGVKAVLAVLIAVMVWIPHLKKRESTAKGHFIAIGAMVVVTAGVAVFWQ